MVTVSEFSRLVTAIHAAAVQPEHWGGAVAAAGRAAGAAGGALIITESGNRVVKSASIDREALQAYRDRYHRVDYVLEAVEQSPVGLTHNGRSLIALDQRSEFNVDWMQPYEMDDGLFVRLTEGAEPAVFLVAAPGRSEPFVTAERVELVNALVPHLQQALRTQQHLRDLRQEADDAAEAVDSMPAAVLVVGPENTVLHANSSARTLLSSTGGLSVVGGRLRADIVRADDELQGRVAMAMGHTGDGARRGSSLLCPREGGRPLVVHVFPFSSERRDGYAARALVVVVDPECRRAPTVAMLRGLFGLTQAEADVAVRVAKGEGLTPIAEDLMLSLATVKTHVRHIFEKTDTHRQAELVRLLCALNP